MLDKEFWGAIAECRDNWELDALLARTPKPTDPDELAKAVNAAIKVGNERLFDASGVIEHRWFPEGGFHGGS